VVGDNQEDLDTLNMASLPEPWLRGPIPGANPLIAPLLYSFQHAREDLARYAGPLTVEQIWARPYGMGSAGFHLLHIAGSTDRLITYLEGRELTPEQRAFLAAEETSAEQSAAELLAEMDRVFEHAEAVVRAIDPAALAEARWVGRKRMPTTVIGLLTHIAEHTLRHVGQAISAAKLAVAAAPQSTQGADWENAAPNRR
jgi:uncharacterized damage-inducible protein DinB